MKTTDEFEAIVSEHYEALFRFAMSLTRTETDAWDLTQQTFYVWATKGHQLRDRSRIKTWLFTTLHRDFLKARHRQSRFPHCDLDAAPAELPDDFAGPSDAEVSSVLPALARVDEVYQAAVALFYLEDCSYKEIAVVLDVPLGTVRSRIARGLAQLKRILATMNEREGEAWVDGRGSREWTRSGTEDPVASGNHSPREQS